MKKTNIAIASILCILSLGLMSYNTQQHKNNNQNLMEKKQDSVLRHVVLFKFKDGAPKEKITEIEEAFMALPSKIPQIVSLEWGLNNSPEGLNKGFTHCYFLTFKSEADRAIYLPHPDHKAFGKMLGDYLDDVLVVDYWSHK